MIYVFGKTVMAYDPDYDKQVTDFMIWNTQGHQWHRFQIQIDQSGFDPGSYCTRVIVSSCGKSFIFFELVLRKVRFTRMDLSGQVEGSGSMNLPNMGGYTMRSRNETPGCTSRHVTLWSYAKGWEVRDSQLNKSHALEVMRVVYDTYISRIEVQIHVVKHSIDTYFNAADFVWWNDVAYFWNESDEIQELHVLDLKASICKRAEMSVPVALDQLENRCMEEDLGPSPILYLGNQNL